MLWKLADKVQLQQLLDHLLGCSIDGSLDIIQGRVHGDSRHTELHTNIKEWSLSRGTARCADAPKPFLHCSKAALGGTQNGLQPCKASQDCAQFKQFLNATESCMYLLQSQTVLSPTHGQTSCIEIANLVHGIAVVPTEGANALLIQLQILILSGMRAR